MKAKLIELLTPSDNSFNGMLKENLLSKPKILRSYIAYSHLWPEYVALQ